MYPKVCRILLALALLPVKCEPQCIHIYPVYEEICWNVSVSLSKIAFWHERSWRVSLIRENRALNISSFSSEGNRDFRHKCAFFEVYTRNYMSIVELVATPDNVLEI